MAEAASAPSNPFDIPRAPFIEDIDKDMAAKKFGATAEEALRICEELYRKYKFMESNYSSRKTRLEARLPDLKSTLAAIQQLEKVKASGEPITTTYALADSVYASAKITDASNVCLWLGANVMLEYPVDEAAALLQKNISETSTTLEEVRGALDFLRDQQTTMEVNMARIYNWDVQRRRTQAAKK
eukprot:m.30129 g.30129  ORF g.30129 m.30129 type:complete len:185 (+) comp9248_c0_seq1:261-815(+)